MLELRREIRKILLSLPTLLELLHLVALPLCLKDDTFALVRVSEQIEA